MFVALNSVAYDADLEAIKPSLESLSKMEPHAVIVSDIGLARLIHQDFGLAIHSSTQASICNAQAAQVWKDIGAKRVVLARECSYKEASFIGKKAGIETEVFVHGAMCSSYSGRCIISNVTSGRDSNRGGCVQSCRHLYQFNDQKDPIYIMNSKDLNAYAHLEKIISLNIDALKIEGRMKSPAYVASVVSAYKEALERIALKQVGTKESHLNIASHRPFGDAFSKSNEASNTLSQTKNSYEQGFVYVGHIKEIKEHQYPRAFSNQSIHTNEDLWVLKPNQALERLEKPTFLTLDGMPIQHSKQNHLFDLKSATKLEEHSILLKKT